MPVADLLRRALSPLVGAALALAATQACAAPPPVINFAVDQDYFPGKESLARVAEDFVLAHRIGVRIIRPGVGWDDTNPRPGEFRWEFWSGVVNAAQRAGIEIQPYYAYTPAWAGAAYNDPPRRDSDFASACGALASAIGGRVPTLEIWNEPDNAAFWTGGPRRYGDLIGPCAAAIRAAGAAAKIVLGGLVYLDSPWLERSGARAPRDYDIAAFHQYTETPWDPTTVEKITSPVDYFRGYDRLSQHGSVPVWMDEGGASTAARLGYSEASQASWIRRTILSLLDEPGRPLSLFGLYQLRDPDPRFARPIGDKLARQFFMHTGLFTLAGRPKLAAATYGDLVSLFDGRRPAPEKALYVVAFGHVSHDFRLHALGLEDGRQVVAIWDRQASSSGAIRLPMTGRAAFLHRADGRIVRLAGFDGRRLPVPALQAGDIPLLFEIR